MLSLSLSIPKRTSLSSSLLGALILDCFDSASTRSQRCQCVRILGQIDTDGPIQETIRATRSPVDSRAPEDGAAYTRNNSPGGAVAAFELDQAIQTAAVRVGVIVEVHDGFDWLGSRDGMPARDRCFGSANVIQCSCNGVGYSRGLWVKISKRLRIAREIGAEEVVPWSEQRSLLM